MSYHVNPIAPVLPRLGARSVGALPTLSTPTLDQAVRSMTINKGPDAGALYRACMTDPIGSKELRPCFNAAWSELPLLKGDQLAFYKNCMASRSADIPVLTQHTACFWEAKKLSPAGAAAPAPAPGPSPGAAVPAPEAPSVSAFPSRKWLWIGGVAAAAGLAVVLLRR